MGDFSILAQRIKSLRLSLKLTQREFAKKAGCTAATLSAYENGSKSPSLEIVKGIAEAFGVSIDWLCGLSEQKERDHTYETYGEIIEALSKIWYSLKFRVLGENPYYIVFYDEIMDYFLKDCSKMIDLCSDGTIDEKLFHLWVKDKENEFNVKLYDPASKEAFLTWLKVEEEF